MIEKIVSGGQTGVDRAALDVAIARGVAHGGWCPLKRRAEDGRIADRYLLTETPLEEYRQRTRWNVRDADGTLIFTEGVCSGGTALTRRYALKLEKPLFVVDVRRPCPIEAVGEWIIAEGIRILNIAGPRRSSAPAIETQVVAFLTELLDRAY